jgi:capsular polysaccharide export protein
MNYFFGFSYWKHPLIEPFFDKKPIFINPLLGKNYLKKALQRGLNPQSAIYIWGKKKFPAVEQYARENAMLLFRIEDGFIRSVGLGSDLTQPYSLVIDSRGIYFDPTCESDLEYILQTHVFSEIEIKRAKEIQNYLIEKKISKYNLYSNVELNFPKDKKIIIVPGQVEDDASIFYGANGMTNLKLLQQTRANRPDAYIVYKPHPDVLVGNRIGTVIESDALSYCDRIVTEVGIDSVLAHADEVHTMTSLVGFEAMMRGIKVVTYGVPFYAGWGLSEDSYTCERRSRILSIDELIAGTYLLYPRYIHPETKKQCEIEEILSVFEEKRSIYRNSNSLKIRNWISRKSQQIYRTIQN